jgi:putative flippase GtrA
MRTAASLASWRARVWRGRVWRLRVARFLVVGAVNTLFGYGVFYMLLHAGQPPAAALALATVIGVAFNFLTTGRIVFDNRDPTRLWRFVAVYGVVFLLNAFLLEGARRLGLGAALAQLMLTAPCVFLSYRLNRALVFSDRQEVRHS